MLLKLQALYPDLSVLVLSGEAEERTLPAFLELLRVAGLPFHSVHHRSLREAFLELQRCDLFLGHDSGMAHLAGCVPVPSVVLFGETEPAVWAPAHEAVAVIQSPDKTMGAIACDSVVQAAVGLLEGVQGTHRTG